ncbi:unnamed protein product, partial [Brachionus calyciflorus]
MSKNKNEILEHSESVVRQIDIHTEKCIRSMKRGNNQEKLLESLREKWISKIKQIQEFNLSNLTNQQVKRKYCFFIPNVRNKLSSEFEKPKSQNKQYSFNFINKLGYLVISNLLLSPKVLNEILEVFNTKESMRRIIDANLDSFGELAQCSIICDLLVQKLENPNEIIDLSKQEENIINPLAIIGEFGQSAPKNTDFDFMPNLLNMDRVERLAVINRQATYFPKEYFQNFKNVNDLNLTSQNLDRVIANNFLGMNKLETLFLCHSQINTIEKDAFNGLKNLKTLHLINNNLSSLHPDLFNGLESLECLSLDRNNFTIIKTNSFIKLKMLKKLSLNQNKIEKLQQGALNGLESLKHLELNDNQIKNLDYKVFENSNNLEALDIGYNPIERLEEKWSENLKNLKFLNLRQTKLTNFKFLNLFQKLEFLDMCIQYENSLIDVNSLNLPNLKFLIIGCFSVPKFNENYKNLQCLEIVVVNDFKDNCFDNLINLEYLKITATTVLNNQILSGSKLKIFNPLKKLKYFSLENPSPNQECTTKFHNVEQHVFNTIFNGRSIRSYTVVLPTVPLLLTE